MSETNKKIGIENFYATTITKPGGISASGDLAFTVSVPPQYPRGFLIVDPNDANKRERMYYHDVIGNTVYVRFANRSNPQAHSQGAPVQMNDMAEIFNFIQSCTSSTGYIEKGNGLDIIVWGGPLVINADNSVTSALDTTLTLTDGTINYVYFDFDDSEYKSTTSELAIVGLEIARVTCAGGFVAGIENIYSRLGRDGSTGQPGPQGAPGNGIESITLISTVGIDKTYRITFTDATTFDYVVTDGADGNGIASVALISTIGNIKTYRITFTDTTTFDFVVTDGANGTDGIDGTDGTDGRGIASIIRTSGTGAPGTTDTYTITYTDATTSTFTVYNGANGTGSIVSVSGSMVDNTDPNNPVILSDSTKADKTNLNKLNFDTTPVPGTTVEGDIFYNETDKTLNIVSDGMTLQVGQETVIRARNITGSAILNNQVVYIAGADSNRPTIVKAQASSLATSDVLGVCTQDIANGTDGFVTVLGIVRDVDTSAFAAGDTVYLSPTTAGTYTNVKPTSPNYIRIIGKVLTSNATTGTLFVNTTVSRGTDAEQIFEDQKEPMGIPDSQRYNVNISHNLATREVTINGTFFYYYKGIKYIKTAVSETVTHSASIGSKFVYYVGGTLTVSDTPWDIREVATVTIVFYNNTAATTNWAGPAAIVLEERHGITMDTATHKKIHDAIGCTVVGSGFSLNGTYSVATGTGGLVANSFGVDSGIISDEDLETTIPTLTDNSGVGNQYPVFYKTGASGEWRWFFTNLPYLFTATNITYNQNNGGTWQQTQVTANGNYMNMYVVAVPALNDAYKFAFVQGQSVYSGAGALAAAQSESILQLDLSGFPFVEAAPVQKITFRREATYNDNGNCRIEATQKIIGTRLSVVNSSTSPSIHNNLSGRSDTNTHPASSITNTPSGNIAATTVQEAIDELDTEKVPTSRTLTINGTTYDLSADRSWTISGGGNSPVVLFSTAGTAYSGKVFKLPAFTGTISKIMISLDTLPAGGNFEFYIEKNGTSMMSGNLTITTTETVSNLLYTVKTGDSGKSTMTTTAVSDEDRIEGFIVAGSGNTFLGAGVTVSALMTAS